MYREVWFRKLFKVISLMDQSYMSMATKRRTVVDIVYSL